VRTQVQAFIILGLSNHQNFEEEMFTMEWSVLMVCGEVGKRTNEREMYGTHMKICKIKEIGGIKVSWENTSGTVDLMNVFHK
jgi:hypothetical protein